MQEIGFEESEEEVISTSEIKEILGMWERVGEKNTQKKFLFLCNKYLIFINTFLLFKTT